VIITPRSSLDNRQLSFLSETTSTLLHQARRELQAPARRSKAPSLVADHQFSERCFVPAKKLAIKLSVLIAQTGRPLLWLALRLESRDHE